VDGLGNSYVTGGFTGSPTFGGGEANETTLTSPGGITEDIFVAKYDPDGNLIWARQTGGPTSSAGYYVVENGYGIAVDGSGNSYVTGNFWGSAIFGAGDANETTLTSAGDWDIFVAKYDSGGNLIWAKRAGASNSDEAYGIAVDDLGNSYVTGRFNGSATFGAGEANETTLDSAGFDGSFVAKFSTDVPTFDVDSNGTADALTDGLLKLRYLFGFRGNVLIDGVLAADCTRCTAAEIEKAIEMLDLDVDGNGAGDALTDGLLCLRYLFGFRSNSLIDGVLAANCTRCTAPEIETFMEKGIP